MYVNRYTVNCATTSTHVPAPAFPAHFVTKLMSGNSANTTTNIEYDSL